MVEIALRNMYKKYDNAEHYFVTNLNLGITDRELIVFVRPSSCGKPTTLRMIAGLEGITEGELSIGGKVMSDIVPRDRDTVAVFQNYALYSRMTVFDSMASGLKLRKYGKVETRKQVENAADILDLTEYLQRKPTAPSSEQCQRVVLGRAVVRDTKVFLIDEPLLNLDAKLYVAMRAEIAKLYQRLETTTVYVTHDQIEVMIMADRIVIMKDNLIQQTGSPKEAYNTPKNMFVAGFIGSSAVNFFKVTSNNGVIPNQYGLKLAIPEGRNKKFVEHDYGGKELVFGIRPEDIHSEQATLMVTKDAVIKSEVVVSELLGIESMLYTRTGDTEFISKVDAHDFHHPGEVIDLVFDTSRRHFFNSQVEEVIK